MTSQWSPRSSVLQVVQVDEVWVLEVQAVADAAKLGVGAAADEELEGDFLTAVGDGEVDLAKPALAEAALDGEAVERALAPSVGEPHDPPSRPRSVNTS